MADFFSQSSKQDPPFYKPSIRPCLAPCKALLCNIFSRLQLKGEPVRSYFSASSMEIEEFWNILLRIDETLDHHVSYTKSEIKDKEQLLKFLKHCCQERHYLFCIKKCGGTDCTTCTPPRMPEETFPQLHNLPDPLIGEDEHYQPFVDVFGTTTTEKDRPSLQPSRDGGRRFTLKNVKNANLMLQCEQCSLLAACVFIAETRQ